jgi:gag-polypeptide of LTR copia-type/Integrase core domain/GAG-pre-integrase domain
LEIIGTIGAKMVMESSSPKFKPLSNSNYAEWSGEMKAWLMKLGYWRLVAGKEKQPSGKSDPDTIEKWEAKAEKAAGEIYLAVENDQRVHFRGYEEDPVRMWALLEQAHVQKKPGARFNAYDDLFSIQKNDDETLVEMAVQIEQAVGNIKNLRPKDFTIDKLDDELQCMALIRALPEEYSHFSTSLLLLDSLDKDKILQAFRSEELNRSRRMEVANRAKANYNHAGTVRRGACHVCKKDGHWANKCPELQQKRKHFGQRDGFGGGGNQAKKAEEKAEVVTESAGNASAFYFNAHSTSSNVVNWNTDTGATSHMTPHRHWIRNYTPYRVPIRLADNRVIYSEGVGTIIFRPTIDGQNTRDVELTRILHVPALENNLLAVLYLTRQKNFEVHITFDTMAFSRNGTVLFTATIDKNNVGYLNGTTLSSTEQVNMSSTLPLDLSLWHKRLCHHNHGDIRVLLKDNLVDGMVIDSAAKPDPICEPCLAGKMHANPFTSSNTRATELLGLVHSDLHHVGTPSNGGFNYWITFIDDHSRFKVVIPLKKKSDSFGAFKTFKAYAENATGMTLKAFRCDKGGEYMSREFIDLLDKCGVVCQYTVRNRPQQNGVAERANRTLVERITAMLAESGLPK